MFKAMARRKGLIALGLVAAIILSLTLSGPLSSPQRHRKNIAYLDDKRTTVSQLTAAAALASTAISWLPDDAATPVAQQLAGLSFYLLIVLCAIFLEKYLLTVLSLVSLRFILPAALALLLASLYRESPRLRYVAVRLLALGVAALLVIPVGIEVSMLIEDTYRVSIQETIDAAKSAAAEMEPKEGAEEEGFWSKVTSSVKEAAAAVISGFEDLLGRFMEALAVLIVTSCLLPLLVLFLLMKVAGMAGSLYQRSAFPALTMEERDNGNTPGDDCQQGGPQPERQKELV